MLWKYGALTLSTDLITGHFQFILSSGTGVCGCGKTCAAELLTAIKQKLIRESSVFHNRGNNELFLLRSCSSSHYMSCLTAFHIKSDIWIKNDIWKATFMTYTMYHSDKFLAHLVCKCFTFLPSCFQFSAYCFLVSFLMLCFWTSANLLVPQR